MNVPATLLVCVLLALNGLVAPPAVANGTPAPAPSWLESASGSIEALEYEASASDRGLQAPNRAQDLRTFFEPSGARIEPRNAPGETLTAIRTTRFGRAGMFVDMSCGEIQSRGPRVEIRRPGLTEWYVNSASGLEHGYTIPERPPGDGSLEFEVVFEGASVTVSDGVASIVTVAGRKLVYGKLEVVDASGREIGARMEPAGSSHVRLVVDDAGAAYPIVVDPLLSSFVNTTLFST